MPYESYSITNEEGFVPQDEKFENGGTMREADKKMYYIVPPKTFAYNPARINVGSIGYQDLAKNVIVSSLYEVFKTTDDVDDRFLWHWFKSNDFQKLILQLQEGGVRLYFYYDKLCMGKIALPTFEEQKRIGCYLDKLDNLITLHQRNSFCKILTVKMITSPWEQRKLGDMSLSFEYGLNAAAKDFDGENKYIRITDINDSTHEFMKGDVTSPDTDLSKAEDFRLVEGDILFARTGASVGKSYIYRPSDGLVYYAGFLIRAKIKEDYDPEFLFQNTYTNAYKKFIEVTSMRSGQPGVNAQEYSQYEIRVPNKDEQNEIGNFFRSIDNLITLHQRKYK